MKNQQTTYCPFCNSYEEYIINEVADVALVKGKKIPYQKHETRCAKCGKEIYVDDWIESDQLDIYESFKEEAGLLGADEIRCFRHKNHLSATKLSRLLGLGDKTITRIENGEIQSKSTDMLLRLFFYVCETASLERKLASFKNQDLIGVIALSQEQKPALNQTKRP